MSSIGPDKPDAIGPLHSRETAPPPSESGTMQTPVGERSVTRGAVSDGLSAKVGEAFDQKSPSAVSSDAVTETAALDEPTTTATAKTAKISLVDLVTRSESFEISFVPDSAELAEQTAVRENELPAVREALTELIETLISKVSPEFQQRISKCDPCDNYDDDIDEILEELQTDGRGDVQKLAEAAIAKREELDDLTISIETPVDGEYFVTDSSSKEVRSLSDVIRQTDMSTFLATETFLDACREHLHPERDFPSDMGWGVPDVEDLEVEDAELMGVRHYIAPDQGNYNGMNGILRERKNNPDLDIRKVATHILLATSYLNRQSDRAFEGTVSRVIRADRDPSPILDHYRAAFKSDRPVVENAFTSTSEGCALTETTKDFYAGGIVFLIQSYSGTDVGDVHEGTEGEREVLFRPQTEFRVLSEPFERDGKWFITMEECK